MGGQWQEREAPWWPRPRVSLLTPRPTFCQGWPCPPRHRGRLASCQPMKLSFCIRAALSPAVPRSQPLFCQEGPLGTVSFSHWASCSDLALGAGREPLPAHRGLTGLWNPGFLIAAGFTSGLLCSRLGKLPAVPTNTRQRLWVWGRSLARLGHPLPQPSWGAAGW